MSSQFKCCIFFSPQHFLDEEFQIILVDSFIINLPVLAVTEITRSNNAESIFLRKELDTKKKVVYNVILFCNLFNFILLFYCIFTSSSRKEY